MPWTTATTRSAGYSVTATVWNSEHVDNMNFLREVNYTQYTADVTLNTTTVGTAVQIVTSGAITYEAVPHVIEFFCPALRSSTGQCFLILRDSTTVLGTIMREVASGDPGEIKASRRLTPTAASHSYNIAGWLSAAGSWVASGGSGGTAGDGSTYLPGFIRIWRIPT
jgi:hypothetical protein